MTDTEATIDPGAGAAAQSRLQRLRDARGISRPDLAEQLAAAYPDALTVNGKARTKGHWVNLIERLENKGQASTQVLAQIAQHLGVDITAIVDLDI